MTTEAPKLTFCEKCSNYIHMTEISGNLVFVCHDCGFRKKPPEGKAVKIFEKTYGQTSDFDIDMKNIHLLVEDPINPRIRGNCPKENCKSEILVYRRSQRDMNRMFVCPECKFYWFE